jgi:nitric oxide reductase subunit C
LYFDAYAVDRDAVYIEKWLRDPLAIKTDSKMPKLPLSEEDIVELVAFLSQLKGVQK